MRPLDRLSEYLSAVERRLRLLAITRGIAAIAAAALIFTVVAVLLANYYAFSNPSVLSARLLLFFGIAFAIAAALVLPVIRLNRRRAAREAETKYPQFEERLLTFTERVEQNANDPFLHLLADDTLSVAQQTQPKEVAKTSWLFSFSSAAAIAAAILLWLGLSGPGFLGYGTSLLWGGLPKGDMKPFYDIDVQPGNHTVKKRGTEIITARLHGFTAPRVRFFGKYASSSQWEPVDMRTQPDGTAYEFVIPGLLESMDYYVEAGGVHSKQYKLTVIDLPSVKNMTTTYHFPAWTGLKDATEKGGDLRAVEGTVADVEIQTDKPLTTGALLLDDGSKLPLRSGPNGTLMAKVPIQKDGQYHVVAVENGEDVRLTEEFFIEAQKDRAPEVKITKPGRDFRASPIEEVTVTAEATDDFGLKAVDLHYSVNGGAEKTASVLQSPGAKNSNGSMTIPLEDFKVVPGDIVSLYATAKDARSSTNTDIFFVEVQPFERNYSQSQQGGGGGGAGGQDDQNEISQRQKEIITATFNQLKGNGAKASDSENATFLSQVQSKLRDQAKSLADRMKSRQLSDAGDSFKEFVNNMEQAVANMGPAADKLKGANWKDALGPEEKALQYLERAEALRRDIQVAFGSRGGGGGGAQGGARDLEGLFDLELDTEKNQFESAQQMQQSGDQRQQQIDDALQKLEQLARRQQELANQKNNPQQLSEKRYQQEMLRREAEQLQKQLDQLTKNMQNSQGQSSQNQQGQPGQPGASGQQQGQQPNGRSGQQQGQQSRSADSQQLNQTVDRLRQALDNMRQAAASQQAGTPQSEADARRAAEQLKEAQQLLEGLRNQQSGSKVDDLARQADAIAQQQQAFEGQLRRAMNNQAGQGQPQGRFGQSGLNPQQAQQLTDERRKEVDDMKRLEAQMQNAVRDLAATQPKASGKLREALGEMQQQELPRDMERNLEYIRRGYAEYAALSEPQITAGINNLRDQLKGVQQAMADNKDGKGQGAGDKENKAVEQALDQVEKLRRQIEQMQQRQGQNGQNGQNGQRGGGQQPGQNSSQNAQSGQPNGQGGNQPGQNGNQGGASGNQGGYQPGNLSRNGGPNGGGGYRNGGSNYGYYGGLGYNNPNPNLPPYEGVRPGDFENQYRETLNTLQALQGQMQNDPKAARDLQDLVREMQRLNPWTYANDPELNARIQADMTAQIETVELELRRKVDDTNGGSVRSAGGGPVPRGYESAVPEYFKKLSKGNK